MAVVLLTDDLMSASRVAGAAQRVGVALVTFADVAAAVSHCMEHEVDRLIVDLSSRGLDAAAIVDRFNAAAVDRPPTIAFGPHVHEKLLAAAAEAGCEQVVSRGKFFAELDAFFAGLVDSAAGSMQRDHDASPDG